ncbi:hypothetical protein BDV95DRAFT_599338 [Massariosphaeria phaeospora]|uniref:Uncharacterized protein n=1 Tax=Massariosphaeria phaeospora TaxID=100035 RepID=A0A7C8MFP1_9PLEO|nr:hypothetical protein BDV95DRAFT_599338 [Massariosphaeria phaeospora]
MSDAMPYHARSVPSRIVDLDRRRRRRCSPAPVQCSAAAVQPCGQWQQTPQWSSKKAGGPDRYVTRPPATQPSQFNRSPPQVGGWVGRRHGQKDDSCQSPGREATARPALAPATATAARAARAA